MAANAVPVDSKEYNAKPPLFDGEKFEYWKDRIESFLLGFDMDLWDMVMEGYEPPKDTEGNLIPRSSMNATQRKRFKDHHRARTIMLNAISHDEYEKITNKETAKSIYDSLQMTHQGNAKVRKSKALALIQKYEAFKMKDDESIAEMFSRFQTLTAGLKVLKKSYSEADHVNKIIRSLPPKWLPLTTALSVSTDLDSISMEELMGQLSFHELVLMGNEPQRKIKSVALRSKPDKAKALQAEEESDTSEEDTEDEELSLLSRRMNKLWKQKRNKFDKARRPRGKPEGSSGQRKDKEKEVICYECKEPGHYKSDCPKLRKDKKPKKFLAKKKGLMATWDDSESEAEDSEEDQEACALMAISEEGPSEIASEDDSDSEAEDEVFSSFTPSEIKSSLLEMMEKYDILQNRYKTLKQDFTSISNLTTSLEQTNSDLSKKNLLLESSTHALKSKLSKLEEEVSSISCGSNNESKYEKSFQYFLSKNINRSMMASMIYGVSRNKKKGIGYSEFSNKNLNTKPKTLYEHFVPSGTEVRTSEKGSSGVFRKKPQKNKTSKSKTHAQIPHSYPHTRRPKVVRTSGTTDKKGPQKWVPKEQIVYVSDILSSSIETPVMVPGQWVLSTHDGRKAYVRHRRFWRKSKR